MFLGSKTSMLLRWLRAGAIAGAVGMTVTAAADAQDRSASRSAARRQVRQVQGEDVPPPVPVADELPTEAPLGSTIPEAPMAGQQAPSFYQADNKEHQAEPAPDEPWTLTNLFDNGCGENMLKDNGIKLSGWSSWGYASNPDGSFIGNGASVNQQEWGGFMLNQQYMFLEKVADGSNGFGWGFRVDGMYGLDGNDAQAFGNINAGKWDYLNGFDHGAYEWALPQAYAELAYDKLSVKLGHFYTLVGYEVVPTTGNFFFTKQLNFWNSEPFTHTGALATYKATDTVSVSGGWVAGWDTGFYRYNGGSAFLGGMTWKIDDKTDFVYSMVGGNLGWRGNGAVNSFILSHKWTEKFQTVHQFDVLGTDLSTTSAVTQGLTNGGVPNNSTAFINYAFYDLTSKVKMGARYEWYKADGTSYNTMTGGFNIKPTNWLLIRPEVRGMWSPGNQQVYNGAHGYSGQLFNQTLFALDTTILF